MSGGVATDMTYKQFRKSFDRIQEKTPFLINASFDPERPDYILDLDTSVDSPDYDIDSKIQSPGVGLTLEYDTRDVPTNAYQGQRFETKAIASKTSGDDSDSYQSYYARYRSYHQLGAPVVLAPGPGSPTAPAHRVRASG